MDLNERVLTAIEDLSQKMDAASADITSAHTAIEEERKSRRRQVRIEIVVLILLIGALAMGFRQDRNLEDEAKTRAVQVREEAEAREAALEKASKERAETNCEAINEGRAVLYRVLVAIVEDGRPRRTPEEQARVEDLLNRIAEEYLQPLTCPGGPGEDG